MVTDEKPSVSSNDAVAEEDLYTRLKELQRELEFVEIQEEYVKDEQKNLKIELLRAQEEVKRIQAVPLVIGQFLEMVDESSGIVSSTTGSNYYVRILSTLNRELLKPSSSVALHRHSNALVDILPPEADSSHLAAHDAERPDVKYSDVGGLDVQKQEIREAVELPLTHFDLYRQIGIDPPRGVLPVRPSGDGEDDARESGRAPHDRGVYPRRRVRVCAEVSRRRTADGERRVQAREGKRAGDHLHRRGGLHRHGAFRRAHRARIERCSAF